MLEKIKDRIKPLYKLRKHTENMNRIYRKKTLEFLKLNKNIISEIIDYYILNGLADHELANDKGASFTQIRRKRGKIIKKANEKGEEKLQQEIEWYLMFKDNPAAKKHLPNILRYSQKKGNTFLEMKYYNYPNMRTLLFESITTKKNFIRRWEYIIKFLIEQIYSARPPIDTPADFVEKCHFSKLNKRIEDSICMAPQLKSLFEEKVISVNDEKLLNIGVIIPAIHSTKEIIDNLTPKRLNVIHGDVHANNILCGFPPSEFILLDCRGKSPYGTLESDVAYDIGKIYHEFKSYYSLIERHNFWIFFKNKENIEVKYRYLDFDLKERYDEYFKEIQKILKSSFTSQDFGNWEYRAEFIEAMLYVTMVPFHLREESEGILAYITGVKNLNDWLKKYHPEIHAKLVAESIK